VGRGTGRGRKNSPTTNFLTGTKSRIFSDTKVQGLALPKEA
jgi:hypothetical protein